MVVQSVGTTVPRNIRGGDKDQREADFIHGGQGSQSPKTGREGQGQNARGRGEISLRSFEAGLSEPRIAARIVRGESQEEINEGIIPMFSILTWGGHVQMASCQLRARTWWPLGAIAITASPTWAVRAVPSLGP